MSEATQTATVAEHIQELRRRVVWIVALLLISSVVGYLIRDVLISIIKQPLSENLYYTTPGGAFSFIMKLSITFGLIVSLPVITYQIFSFFLPVLGSFKKRQLLTYVFTSLSLAALGIIFAYFVSLPAALHFLVSFGSESNIKSLITANEYFNFVLTYLAGFAVLFQVPLVILLINRLRPLPPKKLLGSTRYVILASFVISAIITPTPDPVNQAIMAVPVIILYVGTVLILATKALKKSRPIVQSQPLVATLPDELNLASVLPPATITASPNKPVQTPTPSFSVSMSSSVSPTTPSSIKPRLISDFIRVPVAEAQ